MKFINTLFHFLQSNQNKKKNGLLAISILFSISFIIALLSHSFFLSEWFEGRYMTGMNDGLSQMLPFKKLLYHEYSSGNFFYSDQFGMGGGIYSQLSYYFSTSIVFIITVLITYMLEMTHLIKEPDIFYWADAILIVSVIRMTLIISLTTLYFRYMNIQMISAFIGAVFYGTSVIYFRHVTYWEFFADAMLWLPLLLFGIEKVIKEKKAGWFTIAISISLFDNFYFAYINFLLASIYIIFRWFMPLYAQETSKIKQIKLYGYSGLAGFGISAISFIPAVYGYLNNHRMPYEDPIPILGVPDNLLLDGRIIVLPAFVVLCLFVISFYKNKMFRFFACLTILSVMLHFSPIIASAFNGFSAPQYRWEYFLSLMAGGVVATGLQQIHQINRRHVGISIACTFTIFGISYLGQSLYFSTAKTTYLLIATLITITTFSLYAWKRNKLFFLILSVMLVMLSLYTSNLYQMIKLPNGESTQAVTKEYMKSDQYNGRDQLELIQEIQQQEGEPFYRMDWMIETRNNTPLVQDFHGFSVYSSILNKHLLYYYLYDLEIDMGRESVSRYGTLGDRANLHSILSGKYYITEEGNKAIPYGFKKERAVGNYVAYRNMNLLPFVRTTHIAFTEEDLLHASPIAKERAMVKGIVLKKESLITKEAPIPKSKNIIDHVAINTVGSSYQNQKLEVRDDLGGLDILIENPNEDIEDYYISFYLKRLDKDQGYKLLVNNYETSRKKNTSIYRTSVDHLTIRVPGNEPISIRLPKGIYKLADLSLFEEDYQSLTTAKKESEQQSNIPFTWSKNKINITYNNVANEKYMSLPVPYEKGWRVYINGQESNLLQANYAFIGVPLQSGLNQIEFVYYPPYFFISLFISIFSFILVLIFRKMVPIKRKSSTI